MKYKHKAFFLKIEKIMNLKRIFRFLIVLEWGLVISGVIIGLISEPYLPIELRQYIEISDNVPLSILDYGVFLFVIINIIASVGLFIFWHHARIIYLLICILGFFLSGLYGPYVESGWESAFSFASEILTGVIIALIYFSPIKDYFQKSEYTQANSSDAKNRAAD